MGSKRINCFEDRYWNIRYRVLLEAHPSIIQSHCRNSCNEMEWCSHNLDHKALRSMHIIRICIKPGIPSEMQTQLHMTWKCDYTLSEKRRWLPPKPQKLASNYRNERYHHLFCTCKFGYKHEPATFCSIQYHVSKPIQLEPTSCLQWSWWGAYFSEVP